MSFNEGEKHTVAMEPEGRRCVTIYKSLFFPAKLLNRDDITGILDQDHVHSPVISIADNDNPSHHSEQETERDQLEQSQIRSMPSIPVSEGNAGRDNSPTLAPDLELGDKRKRAESTATESSPPKAISASMCNHHLNGSLDSHRYNYSISILT